MRTSEASFKVCFFNNMMKKILDIKNLQAWYEKIKILHGVNVHVYEGEIVSIIGPNGAGKSTLLKSIFGITHREGDILFCGESIMILEPRQLVEKGIAYIPQGRAIFSSLTVLENLELGAYVKRGCMEKNIERMFKLFPVLRERQKQKAGLLSGGEQQMVALARTLMMNPILILLDEPSLGLSPKMKRLIFEKIAEIKKTGVTILLVEQNARMSLEYSDRAYVLELGKNRLEGSGTELLNDKRVQQLYLGGI